MSNQTLILGIESSCDDTSVSLVRGKELVDCIVYSSAEIQAKYGGVVPELAAREHERVFISLVKEIFSRNGVEYRELTHIAYTEEPGLINCLLVGKIFAKTLAYIWNKPLIPINHVYGHIFSVGLTEEIEFPFLALVVSGKTTAIYRVRSFWDIELLESTADNALGEVYDKVARELGIPYPGGVVIDQLFDKDLKVDKLLPHNLNPAQRFSYSGILSAVCRRIKLVDNLGIENKQKYIATVFQKFVIDGLISKLRYWMIKEDIYTLSVSGGVSANKYLREEIKKLNAHSMIVDQKFSNDNAAMIAFYAACLINT